jgi:hypothetical protein
MIKFHLLLICFFCITQSVTAQNKKGIHFQGIARLTNGNIMANKQITLRISILQDTNESSIVYQEIKSITTNVLGLFYTNIGVEEEGKIITIGSFNLIPWQVGDKYILVELDPNNSLHFLQAGFEKINYVPYALYAEQSKSITTILPLELGGTGVTNINDLLTKLHLEKVSNTPDSLKPISIAMNAILSDKLKKADTSSLSNRINQKLNISDTLLLSNRINTLMNNEPKNYYGVFYDSAKQSTSVSTATAVKFGFQKIANKISILNNTAGYPTRISITTAGVYEVNYSLQFIKSDLGTDELNIWFRKNSTAIANSNNTYSIQGAGIKNNINSNIWIELSANDYIELFFSIKNINTALQGTISTTVTPSRPATPAAIISLHSVNE